MKTMRFLVAMAILVAVGAGLLTLWMQRRILGS